MDKSRIEKLKAKIVKYIQEGGSVYDKKNELSYYEYMRSIKRALAAELGRDVSFEEVYALCGINFDRQYHELAEEYKQFISFYEKVRAFDDGNGFVDSMREGSVREFDDTYFLLKNYADKYSTTPFDFLVLMTGYKFKKAYVPIDYISYISNKLKQTYPNGNIEGIRWEHPELYESIRHIRKYLPEQCSMQEVAEFLGVRNDRFGDTKLHAIHNKQKVIQEILSVCPDRNVTYLHDKNLTLYHQALDLSRFEDKLLYQWFADNNLEYNFKMNIARLSKASVDTNKRASDLLEMRAEFLEQFDMENLDDIERYKILIQMLKSVNEKIKNQSPVEISAENFESMEETQSSPFLY